MPSTAAAQASSSSTTDTRPYVIVSTDAHAGPSLERDFRPYCPEKYLTAFDEYVTTYRAMIGSIPNGMIVDASQPAIQAYYEMLECEGLHDPHVFLRDMDTEGIAAQVIFAGGGNPESLPWSDGFNAGDPRTDGTLRALGAHIWNQWLADFVSTGPGRLLGVMQIPIFDLPKAIEEVRWGKEHGLAAINFPAPRDDYPPYNDPIYDPFWAAVEEARLPLVCHVGSGIRPGWGGPGAMAIYTVEMAFYSRRALAQMVFGGVFDRFPGLRLGLVEQRAGWIPEHLRELDSALLDPRRDYSYKPDRMPSDYWQDNCFVGCSFMAHFEAEQRHQIGLRTLMWGGDYPHVEGTWGRTDLALRKTFAGIPADDVRAILGGNPMRVFNLDEAQLRGIADRIGPRPDAVDRPLAPEELPVHKGQAFREFGPFA